MKSSEDLVRELIEKYNAAHPLNKKIPSTERVNYLIGKMLWEKDCKQGNELMNRDRELIDKVNQTPNLYNFLKGNKIERIRFEGKKGKSMTIDYDQFINDAIESMNILFETKYMNHSPYKPKTGEIPKNSYLKHIVNEIELLKKENVSVHAISWLLGFNDVDTFQRNYRRTRQKKK